MPGERSSDELLLPRSNQSEDDPLENVGCVKGTTLIIIVLFVCGVLALGLSAIGLYFYDEYHHDSTTTTPPPTCQKRIVGYCTEHESKDITRSQLEKLTHVAFDCVQMNSNGTFQFKNDRAKQKFSSLKTKAKGLQSTTKIIVSIGGQENSEYFSEVISDSKKQSTFIDSILSFLKENQIDGIDIFWKWPNENDKFKYSEFLKNLSSNLKSQYILSIVAPPAGVNHWEAGFDLDEMVEYVDFINIYSMDYYGPWDNEHGNPAGPTAPLYSGIGKRKNFNVDFTMNYYVCKTSQPAKFNIVIPFFARLWKNVKGAVESGKEVYRNVELKNNIAEGSPYMSRWTVEHEGWKITPATWDDESKSSYIYNQQNGTYLTFENERSLNAKKNYIKENNLGGVWIWTVDMDDDSNNLLNNITIDGFCSVDNGNEVKYHC